MFWLQMVFTIERDGNFSEGEHLGRCIFCGELFWCNLGDFLLVSHLQMWLEKLKLARCVRKSERDRCAGFKQKRQRTGKRMELGLNENGRSAKKGQQRIFVRRNGVTESKGEMEALAHQS